MLCRPLPIADRSLVSGWCESHGVLAAKDTTMVITLQPDLEAALTEVANRQGVAPEVLALEALRERFLGTAGPFQAHDEWERRLLGLAKDCGVSLPNSAFRSEALYE